MFKTMEAVVMAWNKIGNLAAFSLALIFAACGGDSGNNASTEDPSSSPSMKSGTSTTPYSQENLNYSGMTYKTYEGLVAEQPCELSLNLTVAHVSSTNEDYLCGQESSSGIWSWQPYQGGSGTVMGENGRIYETFTDSRDGRVYKMVTIGMQTWMAENLDFATDRSHCFKNATGTGYEECGKNSFGRYYTWSDAMDSIGRFSNDGLGCGYLPNYQAEKCVAVTSKESIRGICPQGWHLPDTTEWNTLLNYVGNPPFKIVKQGLKYFEGATDAYGFSAIPTSYWLFNDCHHCYELPFGEGIYFWAATPNVYDKSINRGFQFNIGGGSIASDWRMREYFDYSGSLNESYAIPARCIRDDETRPHVYSSSSSYSVGIESSTSTRTVETLEKLGKTCSFQVGYTFVKSENAYYYCDFYNQWCKKDSVCSNPYSTVPVASSSSVNSSISWGNLNDARDGQAYKTVTIGSQTWMAENLNYETSNSFCYEDSASYCVKYGRLYKWVAAIDSVGEFSENGKGCDSYKRCSSQVSSVQGICPKGWHLPTETEYDTLIKFVGGQTQAAKKLKSKNGWDEVLWENSNGTDAYGFAALPAGVKVFDKLLYGQNGKYSQKGSATYIWGLAEYSDGFGPYRIFLTYTGDVSMETANGSSLAMSIRCIQD